MTSTPSSEVARVVVAQTPSPSPMVKIDVDFAGSSFGMHSSLSDEERRFYLKMYPTVDVINQRKVHCTVCRMHIGTAPNAESNIKMHPILRVTHCVKCHDFYNSGEFSKGEDGSELYCRWCGQGGEVYCCSTCPYVFCKSCIIKNLSRGVIVDIEQNENWNCFNCTSKILWPLRAQHWALTHYIQTQKRGLQALNLPESELRRQMQKDNSNCCRLAKAKASSLSDSMESLESNVSKRSQGSSAGKRTPKQPAGPPAKRPKSSNDEVVCTPDLLSMLEPDCQISMPPAKPAIRAPVPSPNISTTPRIVTVQQNYGGPSGSINNGTPRSSLPPPLVLSSSGMRYRQSTPGGVAMQPSAPTSGVVRRTLVPNAVRNAGPVFHTINGFRVDLNSAAQQDSYRLPNGRLIQVKRQMPPGSQPTTPITPTPLTVGPQVIIRQRPGPPPGPQSTTIRATTYGSNMGIYNPQTNQQQRAPQVVRVGNASSQPTTPTSSNGGTTIMMTGPPPPQTAAGAAPKVPTLVRHVFGNGSIGQARTQLQEQIFSAMEICTHLSGKVVSLTHSNAYNQVRSFLDLKELYIHMSYLMTYAIGRFKHLQEKCLTDMREMGFKNDANSLENGQLAAEKQASDDEDNEIEIVEPKTDTITIDSDNEDELPSTSSTITSNSLKITSVTSSAISKPDALVDLLPDDIDVNAFSSSILASLLEVDITEGSGEIKSVSPTAQKKQPRKKTTNKPNPALLQLERKRMEELKRTDPKLKMNVVVKLKRVEDDYEVASKWMKDYQKKELIKKPKASEVNKNKPKKSNEVQPSGETNVTKKPEVSPKKSPAKDKEAGQIVSEKKATKVDEEKADKVGETIITKEPKQAEPKVITEKVVEKTSTKTDETKVEEEKTKVEGSKNLEKTPPKVDGSKMDKSPTKSDKLLTKVDESKLSKPDELPPKLDESKVTPEETESEKIITKPDENPTKVDDSKETVAEKSSPKEDETKINENQLKSDKVPTKVDETQETQKEAIAEKILTNDDETKLNENQSQSVETPPKLDESKVTQVEMAVDEDSTESEKITTKVDETKGTKENIITDNTAKDDKTNDKDTEMIEEAADKESAKTEKESNSQVNDKEEKTSEESMEQKEEAKETLSKIDEFSENKVEDEETSEDIEMTDISQKVHESQDLVEKIDKVNENGEKSSVEPVESMEVEEQESTASSTEKNEENTKDKDSPEMEDMSKSDVTKALTETEDISNLEKELNKNSSSASCEDSEATTTTTTSTSPPSTTATQLDETNEPQTSQLMG